MSKTQLLVLEPPVELKFKGLAVDVCYVHCAFSFISSIFCFQMNSSTTPVTIHHCKVIIQGFRPINADAYYQLSVTVANLFGTGQQQHNEAFWCRPVWRPCP